MARYIQWNRAPEVPAECYLVEAVRWNGSNLDQLRAVFSDVEFSPCVGPEFLQVRTSYGWFTITLQDWIARADTGHVGVVRGTCFDQLYGPLPCPPPRPTGSC